jgi:hypothetical protein
VALPVSGFVLLLGVSQLHLSKDFAAATYVTEQLAVVQEHVPAGAPVASGQTGTLGFFRENVVNLDGKVNPDALTNRDDIPGYLRRTGVVWFCDWTPLVNRYLGDPPAREGWQLVAQKGTFLLYHRSGVDPVPHPR